MSKHFVTVARRNLLLKVSNLEQNHDSGWPTGLCGGWQSERDRVRVNTEKKNNSIGGSGTDINKCE